MKTSNLIAALLFVYAFSAVAVYSTYGVKEIKDIKMDGKAVTGAAIGFNVDNDFIHFGGVPPFSTAIRPIEIINGPSRSLVSIETNGNISAHVWVSRNNFIMEPFGNSTIDVIFRTTSAMRAGYYAGTLRIVYKNTGLF